MKIISQKMRCIAPCFRGYGYSSYNYPIKTFKDLANDMVLLIKEHLKLENFYLLGHSYGTISAIYISSWMP